MAVVTGAQAPNIDKADWPVQWLPWLQSCRERPQNVLLGLGGRTCAQNCLESQVHHIISKYIVYI